MEARLSVSTILGLERSGCDQKGVWLQAILFLCVGSHHVAVNGPTWRIETGILKA
jgi:hypothetical protein